MLSARVQPRKCLPGRHIQHQGRTKTHDSVHNSAVHSCTACAHGCSCSSCRISCNRCGSRIVTATCSSGLQHTRSTELEPQTVWDSLEPSKSFATACIVAASVALANPQVALAAAPAPGETTFNISCAACHKGGGNIVQAGATLNLGDLQRNGVMDVDAVYKIVYGGKGKMYGFGEGCAPKGKCTFGMRLSDNDVAEVSQFVWNKAQAGW